MNVIISYYSVLPFDKKANLYVKWRKCIKNTALGQWKGTQHKKDKIKRRFIHCKKSQP